MVGGANNSPHQYGFAVDWRSQYDEVVQVSGRYDKETAKSALNRLADSDRFLRGSTS